MKLGSLVYQINQRFKELERFGESKHQAKEKVKNKYPNKTPVVDGIYSYKTMSAYRQTLREFTPFLREKNIKDIHDVAPELIKEYLQNRQERCLSSYTLSKDMAAFNKFFGYGLTKKTLNLNERKYKNIAQSRKPTKEGLKYNPKNWERQIAIVQNFGVRRESVLGGCYQLKTGSLYRIPDGIYVSVIEKNGKFRNVQCLKAGQSQIENLFPNMPTRQEAFSEKEFRAKYKDLGDHLFNRYTKKIRSHQIRAEFARNLYLEKLKEVKNPVKDYKGFNKEATLAVSKALGHNRESVVYYHYFR